MNREEKLEEKAVDIGLNVDIHRGIQPLSTEKTNWKKKRYSFSEFHREVLFTALGIREAEVWLAGYCKGHYIGQEDMR